MLKYTTLAFLVFFAVSCKKESTNNNGNNPGTTPAVQAKFTYLDAGGNCSPIVVEGIYIRGTVLNATNKVTLQVNVTDTGTYSINISSGNGYGFYASGHFITKGMQMLVVQGKGTPANGAINTLSVSSGSMTCSFTVTVLTPVQPVYDDNDHMYFGNPGNAATTTDSVTNYLMRKPYYALSYNRDKGIPNWVSWHLYPPDMGTISRADDYRPDSSLPTGWYQVSVASYSNSGFDKGHNTPSGDRTSTAEANASTFLMTNMIPQAPQNNQIVWSRLEDSLRRLTTIGYEVYIIMGTYGVGGEGNNGFFTTIDAGRVTVPSYIWKVAVALPNGNSDSSRVDANTRVIAVEIPNNNTVSGNWKDYRVTVDQIEAATGYDLLTRLPITLQATLESRRDNL